MGSGKKIAFCFLVRNRIFNQNIWNHFFASLNVDFEIFCHYKEKPVVTFPVNFVKSIETNWGSVSLVEATNVLYREAFYVHDCDIAYLLSGDMLPMYNNFKTFVESNNLTTFKCQVVRDDYNVEIEINERQYANLSPFLKSDKFLPKYKWKKAHMFHCMHREDFIKIEDSRLLDNYFYCIDIPDENYWCNSMILLNLKYQNDLNYMFSNWFIGSTQAINLNLVNDEEILLPNGGKRETMKLSKLKNKKFFSQLAACKLFRKVEYELNGNMSFYNELNNQ